MIETRNLLEEDFQPETIGGKPILELAARVWSDERFHAFKICYQTMRWVDDLIDQKKSKGTPFTQVEIQQTQRAVKAWMLGKTEENYPLLSELKTIRERFALPIWPWERWTQAMLYDLNHDGFPTFRDYLRYCEGAAVAPGAIFMHLCGLKLSDTGYRPPAFDIRRAARPLSIFCYLVHIMRDLQSDQMQNLNYFADQMLSMAGLNREQLKKYAAGEMPAPELRRLLTYYHGFAKYYGYRARQEMNSVATQLAPPYRLSLELVYGLYSQIYEKMDPTTCGFTTLETNPSSREIRQRIEIILKVFS